MNHMNKTKIDIKPRNPVALAARGRKAGAHRPEHGERYERRQFKQRAASMLARGDRGGTDD